MPSGRVVPYPYEAPMTGRGTRYIIGLAIVVALAVGLYLAGVR